jgi:wyosine [tRNA(Phe)-imidazoG37] synthetase (radical SAM superfamily)
MLFGKNGHDLLWSERSLRKIAVRGSRVNQTGFQHVYGPVLSRRLGRSLGIDLVPFKTCTYDCVYCQLGRTTNKTLERKKYVKVEEVIVELERKLATGTVPDYISLVGSGEPTLNIRIDDLIDKIKQTTDIPVAVITNSSLLWMDEVREALMQADLVIPSLDAGDEWLFQTVNRPYVGITFERMVDGLADFTDRFHGQVWLEVFLLGGIAGIRYKVKKIADLVAHMRPSKVQLNTVTRPPAEPFVSAVSKIDLESLADLFEPRAELIAEFKSLVSGSGESSSPEDIIRLLSRHPCTVEDVADSLGIHLIEAVKQLEILIAAGKLKEGFQNGRRYYMISGRE